MSITRSMTLERKTEAVVPRTPAAGQTRGGTTLTHRSVPGDYPMMNKSKLAKIAQGNGPADERLISGIATFSMLHPETLRILWALAAVAPGVILEFGPYLGGSTVALAHGAPQARIFTVEVGSCVPEIGGNYLTHEHIPSKDIIGDLRKNLARYEVENRVSIFQGLSSSPDIISAVTKALGGRKVGLLFIDADGHVDRDLANFGQLLHEDAFLVFDDYLSEGAPEKAALIRPFVDQCINDGLFSDLGVYQWGTWAGTYNSTKKKSLANRFRRLFRLP